MRKTAIAALPAPDAGAKIVSWSFANKADRSSQSERLAVGTRQLCAGPAAGNSLTSPPECAGVGCFHCGVHTTYWSAIAS